MTNKTAVKDINPNEIEIFKKSLSNESTTLMENDEGYEEALNRWANNAKKRAGLIVMAFTLEDVVATVNFARKHGCDFAVRGGGHSPSGFSSSNGGIVLDMRKRNKVQVDPQQKLVHVQAGAVWGDVNIAVHEHGLAVVGATVKGVGVSGSTLCGGLGFLTPKHGFIIDSLVGATIVLADGSVKQLSSTSNEDLFWAIRGAGPNFGVVTDFIFKAYDQPNKVVTGYLIYPVEKLKEIVDATNDWLNDRQLDEDVFLTICKTPPDFSTKIVMLLFKNDPSHEKFRARFSGYYKLEPIKDTSRPITYLEANTLQEEGLNFNSRRAISGGHVCPPLKYSTFKSTLDSYNDFIRDHPDDNINGAVIAELHNHNAQNITGDATAYPHRKKMYHIAVVQQWTNESTDEDSLKWTKHIANLFSQDHNSPNTITLNFHGPNLVMKDGDVILEDDANPKDAYGDNLERLKKLKAKYDPTIFFDKSLVIRP